MRRIGRHWSQLPTAIAVASAQFLLWKRSSDDQMHKQRTAENTRAPWNKPIDPLCPSPRPSFTPITEGAYLVVYVVQDRLTVLQAHNWTCPNNNRPTIRVHTVQRHRVHGIVYAVQDHQTASRVHNRMCVNQARIHSPG